MRKMVFKDNLYFYETLTKLSYSNHRIRSNSCLKNDYTSNNKSYKISDLGKNKNNVIAYLTNLSKYFSNNSISNAEQRKIINNCLFSEFQSKEEGFLWFALECIEQNSSLSTKVKERLKIEMIRKIQEYGKYYDELLILESLIQYAKVAFEYRPNYSKSCFRFQGKHGLIIYNTISRNCAKVLNHELCHAEHFYEETLPFYEELRASLLSKEGYGRVRALFGLLTLLGDEEVILKCLINNKIEQIWDTILVNNSSMSQMIYKIRNVLESIPNSKKINETLDRNPEIVNLICIIYGMKTGCNCAMDPRISLFLSVYQNSTIYKVNDIRTGMGILPISICYTFLNSEQEITLDLFQTEHKKRTDEIKFRMIQEYLKGELKIIENNPHIPYQVTASYFIEFALGKSFFQQLLRAEKPLIMLSIINYQLSKDLRLVLTLEDFNILIENANKGTVDIGVAKTNFFKIIRLLNRDLVRRRA